MPLTATEIIMAQAAPAPRQPVMDIFDAINLLEIGIQFKRSTPITIVWCRRYGLLATHCDCRNCNVPCNEGIYNRGLDGNIWRCPQCKATTNICKGSFFERSRLHLYQISGLTCVWAWSAGRSRGISVEQCMRDLDIGGKQTIVDWNQFCRDVAVQYFLNHPQMPGGPGMIVEIDQSLFA